MRRGGAWLAWLVLVLWSAGLGAKTVHYYYTDPQGTVLAKTDASGHILVRSDYRPYGRPAQAQGALPAGPGYTGHVNDPDTGLVYMQARYYDPEARMLSVDPVGPTPGDVFGFNRYAYAGNNPVMRIDPDGRKGLHITSDMTDDEKKSIRQQRDASGMAGGDPDKEAPFKSFVTVTSASTSTDDFARITAPLIRQASQHGKIEACARMCPTYDESGASTGFEAVIGTRGSPAWCLAPSCNGGGIGMAVNHSHGSHGFIATPLDNIGNPSAIPGSYMTPMPERFSGQDMNELRIPTYLTGRWLHKFDPDSGSVSIISEK